MNEVLWQEGDGWVDLASLIASVPEVTVVTEHGTVRLLHWTKFPPAWGALGMRLPPEGGHRLLWDGSWGRLDIERATPCGMRVEGPDHLWEESTPVRLLLSGLHPNWVELPAGRATAERIRRREQLPVPAGHSGQRCEARYCCLDPHAGQHWARPNQP